MKLNGIKTKLRLSAVFLALIMLCGMELSAQFVTVGRAIQTGDNCYRMTDTVNANGNADTAAIWWATPLDLSTGFDITVQISVLAPPGGTFFAGDGMAFVLQTAGTAAIGPGGNSLGYAHNYDGVTCGAPYSGGIDPSVAVELDLFHNGVCIADPSGMYDHLAVVENGRYGVAFPAVPPPPFATPGDVSYAGTSTPTCYTLRIEYTTTQTLNVYWDGVLRITRPAYDIANSIFGGNNNVFWGFTAATGAFASRFTICREHANAGLDDVICENDAVTLNGSGGGTYTWSPAVNLSSNTVSNPVFTPPGPGTYPLELVARTDFNCSDRDSVTLIVEAQPPAEAGTGTTICAGQSVQIGATNSDPNLVYSWLPATGLSDPTISNPVASPNTTTLYTVTVVDTSTSGNCFRTDTVTINVASSFTIDAGPDEAICNGDSVVIGLAAQPGLTYTWTPSTSLANANSAQPTAFPTTTTTYTMVATDPASGCSGTDDLTVVVNDITANLNGDTEICRGESTVLTASGASGSGSYSYAWRSTPASFVSDSTTADITVAPTVTTTYWAIVTDNITGCTDSTQLIMTVSELAVDLIADRDTANPGQAVQLTASGGMMYVWSDSIFGLTCYDCPDPIAIANQGNTSWTVTGIDTITGCEGSATVTVILKDYQVPNVFTPNGDGINDRLDLTYFGTNQNIKEVQIYDRWGHQIFATENPRVLWNGKTASGAECPEGVYYMVIVINGDPAIPADQAKIVSAVTLLR